MSHQPFLAAGRALVHWLREGGEPGCAPRSALWLYRWQAFWLEKHYALLRKTGPGAQPFPFPEGEGLVFILGFWRSGTTLLHDLLAGAPGCCAPQTWQCMDPSALLVGGRRPGDAAAIRRPMDEVLVSAGSPQEDEFALMAMGVPSVYRGFLDPRRLPDVEPLLDQSYWESTTPGWQETLECFLSWSKEKDRHRMVLKSPNHLFRFRALVSRYPRAKFIWILRSPTEVWQSNLRMWRAMTTRYGLWECQGVELETFLFQALGAYADLLKDLNQEGTFHSSPVISYEDLVANPGAILSPLASPLALGPWDSWGPAVLSQFHPKPLRVASAMPEGAATDLLARIKDLHQAILHKDSSALGHPHPAAPQSLIPTTTSTTTSIPRNLG